MARVLATGKMARVLTSGSSTPKWLTWQSSSVRVCWKRERTPQAETSESTRKIESSGRLPSTLATRTGWLPYRCTIRTERTLSNSFWTKVSWEPARFIRKACDAARIFRSWDKRSLCRHTQAPFEYHAYNRQPQVLASDCAHGRSECWTSQRARLALTRSADVMGGLDGDLETSRHA